MKIMSDNEIQFDDIDEFLNIMQDQINKERKKYGLDEIKNNNANILINAAFETEVYSNILKYVDEENFDTAWHKFEEKNETSIDNKYKLNDYKKIFRTIYFKGKNKVWNAKQIINYINNTKTIRA